MDSAKHMSIIANSLLELATLKNYKPVKTAIQAASLFGDVR
jgi:hypothetical protein